MDALDELRVRDVFILCRCFPQIAQTETESKNDMILAFVCPHSVKQEDSRQVTQRVPVKLSITVCSTIWFCLPRERIKWNWIGQFVVVFFFLLLYSFFLKCLNKNIDSDRNVCHARCVCRTFFLYQNYQCRIFWNCFWNSIEFSNFIDSNCMMTWLRFATGILTPTKSNWNKI